MGNNQQLTRSRRGSRGGVTGRSMDSRLNASKGVGAATISQSSVLIATEKTNRLRESKSLQTNGVVTPTTFLTSTSHKPVDSTSLPSGIFDGTAPKGGDQDSLSVAQLVVAVLTLFGIGKLLEHLAKKAWQAIVPHLFNPTQTVDSSDDAAQPAAEIRPLVQEHPGRSFFWDHF